MLGPEMRSTGEVMGIADSFGMAFAKAQISADGALPLEGAIFVTVNDHDKANRGADRAAVPRAGLPDLRHRGHRALPARARHSRGAGAQGARGPAQRDRPAGVGQIQLLINTPLGKLTQQDDYAIRRAALQHRVPYTTTLSAASAACDAIIALRSRRREVRACRSVTVQFRARQRERGRLTRRETPEGPRALGFLLVDRPFSTLMGNNAAQSCLSNFRESRMLLFRRLLSPTAMPNLVMGAYLLAGCGDSSGPNTPRVTAVAVTPPRPTSCSTQRSSSARRR